MSGGRVYGPISAEHRAKLEEGRKAFWADPESRARGGAAISAAKKGIPQTMERRALQSRILTGSPILKAAKTVHGLSNTGTYISWASMIQRCYYPKSNRYHLYGARGIRVHADWLPMKMGGPKIGVGFSNFLSHLGERPVGKSIDRIDNEGHYEPGNVRWATRSEQAKNRRPFPRQKRS